MREFASDCLQDRGHDVQVAVNGVEALEIYKKAIGAGEKIDAVILDLTIRGGKRERGSFGGSFET